MKPAIRNTLLVTAMATVLGITAIAMAGTHDCGERADADEKLGHHLDRMSRHLNLTDVQRTQVEAVLKDSQTEMAALRKQMHESRRALQQLNPEQANFESEVARLAAEQGDAMASLIQLRAQTRAAVHPILTPEQREQAREFMDGKRRHKERHRSYL